MSACVGAPLAPRHSWLGCAAWVGVLRLGFRLRSPLLAGVLGCLCARVRAPLPPSHSWHGCALWVCVFGLGFRLRPASPGWGVGLCVCSCARSACTQPLLARVSSVGVCVWARASAAPRLSWLGCWAMCVLVCALRLHPATPGTGARCGCVCLGSGFGCAPPLLAGVLGCVCAPLAPSHSWHGCAVWVFVFGLGFRLRPASPGWGVGLCVCSCARSACTQPLLARVRGVGVCVWARVWAAPSLSWLGWWAMCVLVCALRLHPATPGTGARCGCLCLGSGFGCAPPLLAGVLGCVCALLAPSHSRHGCAVWMCVFGLGFRLRPATPGWGVELCACSACTQPLLARVRGVRVCVCARVSAAPRDSWLGCLAVCALRLHPATPGTGARCGCVCLDSGFGCAPPLLAGVSGCVCALLAPSHSWHACAVWVCVFGLGFRLRPATPGWSVGLCACSACTQPLLARVRVLGVCVWARVSAAARHSWLGCCALCVLRLHPATPGMGARCRCVCLGSGLSCAPPLLARVRGVGLCVWARVSAAPRHSWLGCWVVCVLRLHPATPGTGARCGCVCLGSGFGCAPPLLAGVVGYVCARVRAPLAPSHSWHGCAVWVCLSGLGFWLRPATPGWGVGLCVCSACTQPLLARVRGVGVCVWTRVSAAPRHSWLGCWAVCALRLHPATPGTGAQCGCVCLGSGFGCAPPLLAGVSGCVCAPLAPSHSWHGCAVWVCVFELVFRLRPATPGLSVGLCACCACTQPLLARVRGVRVCVCARVSAAPRHSWLGRWAVCALRLHPATPGTGARCACVCLCSGLGCAPPLLSGVLSCVRAPPAPSHSWHGCAVCVCVFVLGFRLRPCHSWLWCWAVCALRLHPATPGTGARCGCVCLGSGFGCAPPLLAGVSGCVCAPLAPSHSWHGCAVWVCVFGLGFRLRPATPGWSVGLCVCSACTQPLLARVRGVGVCVWARVLAAPRHSWLECWAVCVLRLHPATPGTGARSGCVCLGSVLAAPRHSWLGCWAVCVLRLHPATPGMGARCRCVCLGSGLSCASPLLARVRGVGLCVWARVSAAPRHSWLGCWAVCVLRLHPATPGTGARCMCVCLGSDFGCAPPLLAGVLGCVCAPLAPSHSWHGCAVWLCVFGLGFRLHPATPGWGAGLCACSACTQPLLARVRAVGVCVWAWVSAAPRHSWLRCWAVCVLRLHPATPGTGARCGCVCWGFGFGCAPPLLAGVLGCVCARVRAPLAPSHSWHGCAVWVCVFGLESRLRSATPGCGVGLCVCSACTQPLLAQVRAVGVCVWAWVSAAPRHSWLGCWAVCVLRLHLATPGTGARCGCVCLGSRFGCAPPLLAGVLGCVCARVRAPLAPSHSWDGCAVWVCVFGLGFRLRPCRSWLFCTERRLLWLARPGRKAVARLASSGRDRSPKPSSIAG